MNIRSAAIGVVGLLLSLFVLAAPQPATAHVLIADTTKQIGAVLHISPDDDPVAGEISKLFFDIQDQSVSANTRSFSLKITGTDNTAVQVPISIAGSSVYAEYTFPHQGVYTVALALEPRKDSGPTVVFTHTQRVARGVVAAGTPQPGRHNWAEAGLVASLCVLGVLAIVGFNNRIAIAAHSKQ